MFEDSIKTVILNSHFFVPPFWENPSNGHAHFFWRHLQEATKGLGFFSLVGRNRKSSFWAFPWHFPTSEVPNSHFVEMAEFPTFGCFGHHTISIKYSKFPQKVLFPTRNISQLRGFEKKFVWAQFNHTYQTSTSKEFRFCGKNSTKRTYRYQQRRGWVKNAKCFNKSLKGFKVNSFHDKWIYFVRLSIPRLTCQSGYCGNFWRMKLLSNM